MLTADLVNARRVRGNELRIVPLEGDKRKRAVEVAGLLLAVTKEQAGQTRDALEDALDKLETEPGEKKVSDGLKKLIEDACEFDATDEEEPPRLRESLFLAAAEMRRTQDSFDRTAIVDTVGKERGHSPDAVEHLLYADLRGAQILRQVPALTPDALVDQYEEAQAQGILLRAVKVVVEVTCASAIGYRFLFRKIKFLRLLATIEQLNKGYRITLDGPFSMFESTTKYGLQLALLLPHLMACERFKLAATVRWGKERTELFFKLEGGRDDSAATPESDLPDDTTALLERIRAMETPWKPHVNQDILNLPGAGVCIPDLRFEHVKTGEVVYLEVMGFWSRDAVWKRVELVEAGLDQRILFAVSERLRVSEQALGDDLPSALYVYKGVMNPKAVVERLDVLSAR